MEGYVYLGIFILIGIFFAIQSYKSKKISESKLNALINKNYGNVLDKKYKREDIEKISKYFSFLKTQGKITESIDEDRKSTRLNSSHL